MDWNLFFKTENSFNLTDPFLGNTSDQVQKGVIPNKARAEEIATKQFNAIKKEQISAENTKTSFFKRRREKSRARSKSLGKVDNI